MDDTRFMREALLEARKGEGRTAPNPAVGAVIVVNDTVVARGFHKKAGFPHAEREALADARRRGVDVSGATMYVTLEPCSHTGKTPPCTEAIIEAKLARVVVGMQDPNPMVNGNGVRILKDHGVEVRTNVLERECRELNTPFISVMTRGRPWVVMKAGLSLDGRLNYQAGCGGAITGPESFRKVHELRNRLDGILVGKNTVIVDNPSLTTRLPEGGGRNPVRIIIDPQLSLSPDYKVFEMKKDDRVCVLCGERAPKERLSSFRERGIEILPIPESGFHAGGLDLRKGLEGLAGLGLNSVLIEGGALVHAHFLRHRLVDSACLFYAPVFVGSGGISLLQGKLAGTSKEHVPKLEKATITRLGEDFMVSGRVRYPAQSDLEETSLC